MYIFSYCLISINVKSLALFGIVWFSMNTYTCYIFLLPMRCSWGSRRPWRGCGSDERAHKCSYLPSASRSGVRTRIQCEDRLRCLRALLLAIVTMVSRTGPRRWRPCSARSRVKAARRRSCSVPHCSSTSRSLSRYIEYSAVETQSYARSTPKASLPH